MKARKAASKILWRMKRRSQARDHELIARGVVPAESMQLLRAERVKGAQIEWPRASLVDEAPPSKRRGATHSSQTGRKESVTTRKRPDQGHSVVRGEAARKARRDAAQKYKPKKVRLLLVAEAPPTASDRYFFFQRVASNDWLFRAVIEALFGRMPNRQDKLHWLAKLRDRGVFLIDLKLDPADGSPLTAHVPDLVARCQRLKPASIILIKVSVYEAAYQSLRAAGLPVIDERVPFPSTGQQGKFREKFGKAMKRWSAVRDHGRYRRPEHRSRRNSSRRLCCAYSAV